MFPVLNIEINVVMQLHVDSIRAQYTSYWSSKEQRKQQMGVALYFIDKLALRAGHEKDEDEADTVGCCTLKVCTIPPSFAPPMSPKSNLFFL